MDCPTCGETNVTLTHFAMLDAFFKVTKNSERLTCICGKKIKHKGASAHLHKSDREKHYALAKILGIELKCRKINFEIFKQELSDLAKKGIIPWPSP